MWLLILDSDASLRIAFGIFYIAFSSFELAEEYQKSHAIKGIIICDD